MDKILVSIIVPVYEKEQYLSTCLDSLVNQTLKNIEIIAVLDHPNNNAIEVLKEYEKNYQNFHLFSNSSHLGQGYSRNVGLAHAKGEYIGFVDSDDYVSKTMYQFMYEKSLEYKKPDIIETRMIFTKDERYVDEDFSVDDYNYGILYTKEKKREHLLWWSPSVCNKIFKKTLLENEKFEKSCSWEDILFTTTMGMKAESILSLNQPGYFYRKNLENSVSGINYHPNKKIGDIFKITDQITSYAIKNNYYETYQNEIDLICISSILKRVEEIEYWSIEKEVEKELKEYMYNKLWNSYGSISNLDTSWLSSMVKLHIIEEYNTYTNFKTRKKLRR